MTEIFKAGEHIKIIRTDEGYEGTLGDQTGLVGTVKEGTKNGGVYVTFPHTGDERWYYLSSEITRAPGTTPLPEPLVAGDWVKVVNYSDRWNGTVGQLKSVAGTEARIENVADHTYALYFQLENLEKTEKPQPKPKFAVGDWVEITGYSSRWDGAKGQITLVGAYEGERYGHSVVIKTVGDAPMATGGFSEKYLKASTAPVKFNTGDWVKVVGRNDQYDGIVGTIDKKEYGKFWGVTGTDGEKYQFAEDKLVPTEEPHWIDTKPVGATAQVKYTTGRPQRVVVKLAEDKWLHLYQGEDGAVYTTKERSAASTKSLLGGFAPEQFRWSNDG